MFLLPLPPSSWLRLSSYEGCKGAFRGLRRWCYAPSKGRRRWLRYTYFRKKLQ